MAPERLLGGRLDSPVDVYALGITFYEVFTGETPLGAVDDSRLVELVVDRKVRPSKPPTLENGLVEELWDLMTECWAAEPKDRPSAFAVAERADAVYARLVDEKSGQWRGQRDVHSAADTKPYGASSCSLLGSA